MSSLGYLDYLKAAFRWRARIPGLGRMPINAMGLAAFAVLGLANPGFWFLGAAAEVVYLLWLSSSDRFQNLVDGERLVGIFSERDLMTRVMVAGRDPKGTPVGEVMTPRTVVTTVEFDTTIREIAEEEQFDLDEEGEDQLISEITGIRSGMDFE